MSNHPGLTEDACKHCCWPANEHEFDTRRCPDYNTEDEWLDTKYERKFK